MKSLAPVVLLPGLLCDATLWRAQVEGLADVAAALIPDLTLDETLEDMAARTLALAPSRFSLAALSMGGYVALEIMRQAPERVTRLALFATSATPDSPERAAERRRAMASLKLGRFMGVSQRMLPQLIHPSQVSGPVGEIVKEMAERMGSAAFLRQQRAILSRPDSRPTLGRIQVPTLVGVGDGDVLTPPSDSDEIHRGIAGSTLHIFEKCGHLPALEQPEETTALLRDWLSR
jgi:pimeloyl-ACP methyl ester carboxylesterase